MALGSHFASQSPRADSCSALERMEMAFNHDHQGVLCGAHLSNGTCGAYSGIKPEGLLKWVNQELLSQGQRNLCNMVVAKRVNSAQPPFN